MVLYWAVNRFLGNRDKAHITGRKLAIVYVKAKMVNVVGVKINMTN